METHRGGLCGVTTLSGVSNEDHLRVPPRSQDGLERLLILRQYDLGDRTWYPRHPLFQTCKRARLGVHTRSFSGLLCLIVVPGIQFGSLSNCAWHVPRNRSGPRKFVRCRILLQRREPAIVRGRTTRAVAARPPKALGTA